MNNNIILQWIAFLFLYFLVLGCAKNISRLENQQTSLENRIIVLESQNFKGVIDVQESIQKLKETISILQETHMQYIQELNLLKEDIQSITLVQENNQKRVTDLKQAIQNLKKRFGDQLIEIESIKKILITPSISSVEKSEEEALYQSAFQSFQDRNFENSLKQFKMFQIKYRESKKQEHALYYIAYIHYIKGRYENASLHFYEFQRLFPKSNTFPDAPLWLASSLEKTNDIQSAIEIYKKLTTSTNNQSIKTKAKQRLDELEPWILNQNSKKGKK